MISLHCCNNVLSSMPSSYCFLVADVTDVALEWAEINVKSNPHLSELIEIRNSGPSHTPLKEEASNGETPTIEAKPNLGETVEDPKSLVDKSLGIVCSDVKCDSPGPNVLLGVVKENEYFDFCMCNPPFFDSMSEAGLNPKTACGGTPEEMVCPGGEQAFITHIIEDSAVLKQSFRWYTSMIGRKSNLKILTSKLWEVGVSIVKTTEFVQGETCRWGLAWSFMPPAKKIVASYIAEKNNLKSNLSFMLEGLQRQFSAIHVLKSVESYFLTSGGSCKTDLTLYVVDVTASSEYCDAIQNDMARNSDTRMSCRLACNLSNVSNPLDELRFRISVFQQIPGTLLVRGSLQHKESPLAGIFSLAFQKLEEVLKQEFCREKMPIGPCHPT
ncbi:hypothetical protein GIB67_010687 [Kingdonia uniflora]|uniref:U6 small nuclear RNA (adenine-(43)-N(6))-methyltransferase n=1 Tax=Kingdonia uniflora TaxID=39325 RepID=A0A7J7MPE5_9MAGN|nr:hypothetical protein GIB67_010687 [Kingdonia uniflora]